MSTLDKDALATEAVHIANLLYGTECLLNDLPFTDAQGNRLLNLDAGVAGVRAARVMLEKLAGQIDGSAAGDQGRIFFI
ncbi:MAG: hypothetical protein WCO04_07490 [Pseudomonadota bacterium]